MNQMEWFLKTWRGARAENRTNRMIIAGMLLANAVLAVAAMRNEPTLVLVPDALSNRAEVGPTFADQGFKESWALYMAQTIGNITPTTVEFTVDRISTLLSPRVYQQTIVDLRAQMHDIQRDRVAMRFEPREVLYEKSTDTVFVSGFSYSAGPTGAEMRQPRVFEFQITIDRYRPVFDRIESYQGRPRTQEELNRQSRSDAAHEEEGTP